MRKIAKRRLTSALMIAMLSALFFVSFSHPELIKGGFSWGAIFGGIYTVVVMYSYDMIADTGDRDTVAELFEPEST